MERKNGIVRRIDDLGRIAIPNEILRKLNIYEGDSLEITYTNDGGVFFRKYLNDEEKRKNWVSEMLFKKKEMEESHYTFSVKFIRNITILTMVSWISQKVYTSCAICSPQDEFDEKTGIAVAYARLFNKEIPEYI